MKVSAAVVQQGRNLAVVRTQITGATGDPGLKWEKIEVARILQLPDVREILLSQGTTPIANKPEEARKWFVDERMRWTKVVKESGFRLEQ